MAPTIDTSRFFDPGLLQLEYFKRHRFAYDNYFDEGLLPKYRCYPVLLNALEAVRGYRPEHARGFAKRLREAQSDLRTCDGIISEVLVYAFYASLVAQWRIHSINICKDDFDLKIKRLDGTEVFLEVFCIKPEYRKNEHGVINVLTHTQEAFASVRQKLLRKLNQQKQMRAARENWAVIELNDVGIAGQFTVAASLSDGYKIVLDRESMKTIDRGFDWSKSVFDFPETEYLHGVIDFDLGCYEGRRYILNTRVSGLTEIPPHYIP